MRLCETLPADRAEHYLRPGGPWDVPDLDQLLTRAPVPPAALVVDADERLSAFDVVQRVSRLAGGLRNLGVGRGDVVAWQLPNCIEAVLLFRACWRLGAIAAPLHHRAGRAELDQMLDLISAKVVITAPGMDLAMGPDAIQIGDRDGRYATAANGDRVFESVASGVDLAVVQFTSGSTGRPKAVLHSHRTLAAKASQMIRVHGLTVDDVTLVPAPLAHISGLLNGVLVPGIAGMRSVLVSRWDTADAVVSIADERVSFMVGPPTLFLGLLAEPSFTSDSVASLRVVSTGATGVTPEFVHTASLALGATVKRSYGCTEAPTVTTWSVGDPLERAASTDGHPLDDTEIRVVNPDTHDELPVGEVGEVWVRGPEVFAGYAIAAQTETAVVDGWFRTGDLARLDVDGWLTVVGRARDVIIRGGENITPSEVERVLEQHPDVQQAVVVGIPDDLLGERVAAFIVGGRVDVADCREWFAQQGIARYKTPELVVELDEIPVLSLGKPDRAALQEVGRALAAEASSADPAAER
jgi:acyl-CoA synthetase (AMP-forming)/AMP-acid ligase II